VVAAGGSELEISTWRATGGVEVVRRADDRAPGRSTGTRWMRDATAAGCGQPAQAAPGQRRRCVVIQFVAQVRPPSPQNAGSNRGSVSSTNQV
jgi:hypothetical protein